MILDIEPEKVVQELGHDGTLKIYPELPEPECFKGVHMQEITDVCVRMGARPVHIMAYPAGKNSFDADVWAVFPDDVAQGRFSMYASMYSGIMLGVTASGAYHAVAWDTESAYDPKGFITPWPIFSITEGYFLI